MSEIKEKEAAPAPPTGINKRNTMLMMDVGNKMCW